MESIRVCNLRSLADTREIELKPITILVGTNSSGKSTFLRVFPLLQQSVETKTLSGLLLNEGEVNFGFFPDAIRKGADPAELKFEFTFVLRPGVFRGGVINRFLLGEMPVTYSVVFAQRSRDLRYACLRSITLQLGDRQNPDIITIIADEDGKVASFKINDYQATNEIKQLKLESGQGVVPSLTRVLPDKVADATLTTDDNVVTRPFVLELLKHTKPIFHGKTRIDTKLDIFRSIRIGKPVEMLEQMSKLGSVGSWHTRVSSWRPETKHFQLIRNLVLADATSKILTGISHYLSKTASSVHYFAPVRASAERDYLSRDVEVDSVDPHGANVAFVLASLDEKELRSFREWTSRHFGFEVFHKGVADGARVALHLKEKNTNVEFNLADMGFGYSQMLPFLVELWSLTENANKDFNPYILRRSERQGQAIPQELLVAIEQPELHLHPGLQAHLADLFVNIARISSEKGRPIRFVLETHSSTIIERIGQHVEAKRLRTQDVQVLLFEKKYLSPDSPVSEIKVSQFDENGVLQDWPFGFFTPPNDLPASEDQVNTNPA